MLRFCLLTFFVLIFRFVSIVWRPNSAFFIEDIAVRCANKLSAPDATQKYVISLSQRCISNGIIQLIESLNFPPKLLLQITLYYWFEIKVLDLIAITIWILTLRCHRNFPEVNTAQRSAIKSDLSHICLKPSITG